MLLPDEGEDVDLVKIDPKEESRRRRHHMVSKNSTFFYFALFDWKTRCLTSGSGFKDNLGRVKRNPEH